MLISPQEWLGRVSDRQNFRNDNRRIIRNKNTKTLSEDNLIKYIVKLKTNTKGLFAIAESGSTVSVLNEKTAQRRQQSNQIAVLKISYRRTHPGI